MLMMLAGASLFVYLRLRADLDDRIDASLRARVAAIAEPTRERSAGVTLDGVALEDPEETFVQLMTPAGAVIDTVGTLRGAALRPAETRRAVTGPLTLERALPGVDGPVRLRAGLSGDGDSSVSSDGEGVVVVVGQSMVDRNDALANVVTSFGFGGAVAIGLASLIGYLLATAGLAPVEAMRRRAREVSLHSGDEGLPLPAAHDEVRRLGETLNEMLARLRAAFERESRFVADASHELRTPIAIIKTELEAALQVTGPGSPAHECLAGAVEECDRLAQLAEDLLVIARASDGQLPIRCEPTSAAVLLGGLRDRFADRGTRRGRVIRVEGDPDLLVLADPVRLRQALGNLVENALRHGDGEIVLAARRAADGIEIDVRDEGPGFTEDIAAQAFERFSRGDRARTGQGVGLGLAIVAAIMAAHGGRVAIVGATPTTLRIWLPAPE